MNLVDNYSSNIDINILNKNNFKIFYLTDDKYN